MNMIAVVTSRFNEPVTSKLTAGAKQRCAELKIDASRVTYIDIAGAGELPLMAQHLALTGRYAAIICLGAIIKGETDHYESVCQRVTFGCQEVSLKHNIPVINEVLMTQTAEQAFARAGGDRGNLGADAIDVALEMIEKLQQVTANNMEAQHA